MKELLRKLIYLTGYEIRDRQARKRDVSTQFRPVGNMEFVLQDFKKRGLKCQSILDVGAHKGNWSRKVKKIFPDAQFCLIEPQIEMKPYLESFCARYDDSIFILSGVGPIKSKATFTIWDDLAGSSFLPAKDEVLLKKGKQRRIDIITIDDLISSKKIATPELIKLDIQGYELEALKGADLTFGYTEVYILEVSFFSWSDLNEGNPLFSDVVKFMLDRDYVVYDFVGFLRRPSDGALGQCDVCFVKKDGFFRQSNNW